MAIFSKFANEIEEVDVIIAGGKNDYNKRNAETETSQFRVPLN